jgi:hypothetical protein
MTPAARIALSLVAAVAGACAGLAPAMVAAQPGGFVPEIPLTASTGIGARSMGMGGSGIAAAVDLSALHLNPAALALVGRTEFDLTMLHRVVGVETEIADGGRESSDLAKLRLNLAGFAYPFRTYRGSLVMAGAISRPRVLDRDVRRSLADGREYEFERGGVLDWRAGLAVLVAPDLAVGGALAYLSGSSDRDFTQESGSALLRVRDDASLRGWTGALGVLATAGRRVRLGATLFLPEHYRFEGTQRVTERGAGTDTTTTVRFIDEVDLPFAFGAGVALTLDHVVLTVDARRTDWREIDFAGPLKLGDRDAYRATTSWHVGAEVYLPWAPMRVRAGYLHDPLPYLLLPDFGGDPSNTIFAEQTEERAAWSFGAGTLVGDNVSLDLSVVVGGFRRATAAYVEEVDATRVLITFGYRS